MFEEVVEDVDVGAVLEQQVHELEVVVERHQQQREPVPVLPVQLIRVQLQQVLQTTETKNKGTSSLHNSCLGEKGGIRDHKSFFGWNEPDIQDSSFEQQVAGKSYGTGKPVLFSDGCGSKPFARNIEKT